MISIKKAPAGVKSVLDKRGATKMLPRKAPDPDTAEHGAYAFVFGTAYLVGASDGELTDEEYNMLGQMMADLLEINLTSDQLDELLAEADEALAEHGFEGAIDQLAESHSDPDLRRAAFTLAVAVGCADGALSDEEIAVFQGLADAYEIDAEEANAIIDECVEAYGNG
jgi:tellurite resistance protein